MKTVKTVSIGWSGPLSWPDLLLWKHTIKDCSRAGVESQEFYDCAVVDGVLL